MVVWLLVQEMPRSLLSGLYSGVQIKVWDTRRRQAVTTINNNYQVCVLHRIMLELVRSVNIVRLQRCSLERTPPSWSLPGSTT